MNFLTASVEITVDDKPVKVKLSEIKRAFSQTASETESIFKRMSSSFQSALSNMVRYAKWGGAAIAGALALASGEAMKQENAMFALTGALKASGEYSRETVTRLSEFANAMQEVTTYADEEVLAIMQTANVLGVQSNQLRLAAKWAIALSDALGMGTEAAARYIARALEGEYTMLRRYIPALREAKTTTESFQILQEFMNRAFEVSTAKAQTTSGALKQMRNALGEVGEAIGYALLPALKSVMTGIRDWAMRNRDTIAYWANVVIAYVTYIKDVFLSFVRYLTTDWKEGIDVGLQIALELFVGFGNSLLIIMEETFVKLGEVVIQGVRKKVASPFVFEELRRYYFKELSGVSQSLAVFTFGQKRWLETMKEANRLAREAMEVGKKAGVMEAAFPISLVDTGAIKRKLTDITKETADNIGTIMKNANINISDDSKRLQDKLLELEKYKVEGFTLMEQEMAARSLDLASETSSKIKEINDSLVQEIKNSQENLIEKELKARWESFTESMQNSISSAFERLIFEGRSFGDFMRQLATDILKEFIRIQFIRPAAVMMAGWLGQIGMGFGLQAIGIPPVAAPVAHEGWSVGEYSARKRLVPAHAFAGASRYNWLRPGEEAIIAERGERISRGGEPVNVNINLQAIDTQSGVQFLAKNEHVLANLIQNAMRKNHPYRRGS